MKLIGSFDTDALNERILAAISSRPRGGLDDPLLVLVPTRRLAARLKRDVLDRTSACLQLHVETHLGFCRRVLEFALQPSFRLVPDAVVERWIAAALSGTEAGAPKGDPAAYDHWRRFPGARRALVGAVRDLREAGLRAKELRGRVAPELYRLCADVERSLERALRAGWTDTAGIVASALPHVSDFLAAKKIARSFHYGAYELVGMNSDLARVVDAHAPMEFLLPAASGTPAGRYSARFVASLGDDVEHVSLRTDRDAGSPRDEWIAALAEIGAASDPPREPPAANGGPRLELVTAPSEAAELEAAVFRALRFHRDDGIDWSDLAIVPRSLEPYATSIPFVSRKLNVPLSTSARSPLRRERTVSAFFALLQVLAGDFERAAVIDLFRRRILRADSHRSPEDDSSAALSSEDIDRCDRVSREAGISSGLDAWRRIPEWLEIHSGEDGSRWVRGRPTATEDDLRDERAKRSGDSTGTPRRDTVETRPERSRRSITALLDRLDELEDDAEAWRAARTFAEHHAALRAIAKRRLPPSDRWAPNGLESLFEALEALGEVTDSEPVSAIEVLRTLEEFALSATMPPPPDGEPALRVLDLMQARGHRFHALIWIGFHRGSFPRRGRPDTVLGDASRERIAAATGRLLPLSRDADDEERLLLATTLAGVRERLVVSSLRSDASGRPLGRSPALREVARLFSAGASTESLLDPDAENLHRPEAVPAHPAERVRVLASSARFGALAAGDALVAAGVEGGPPAAAHAAATLAIGSPALTAALAWVEAVEDLRSDRARADVDAMLGADFGVTREWSPTALERLGRCPQAFFFRDVLGVEELAEEADPHDLEFRVLGLAVHEALDSLYRKIATEPGWNSPVDDLRGAALRAVGHHWQHAFDRAASPSLRRLRGLYGALATRWLKAIESFVTGDVTRLANARSVDLEHTLRARIDLPSGAALDVAGRFDRLVRSPDGTSIGDYKTGGKLADRARLGAILAGEHVQLALYREIVAAAEGLDVDSVTATLLGVGPSYPSAESLSSTARGESSARLDLSDAERRGFLESLEVAANLATNGWFPLRKGSWCRYCAHRRTCRRSFEPTSERALRDERLADFMAVQEKRRGRETLAAVRAERPAGPSAQTRVKTPHEGREGP